MRLRDLPVAALGAGIEPDTLSNFIRAPEPALLLAMLLWANMHGGFTLGLMLGGAFGLEALIGARDTAERKSLFFAWAKFGAGAVLVACITPYGWESILVTSRIFSIGEGISMSRTWAPALAKASAALRIAVTASG